jgi:hypothetical protein
MSVVSNGFDLLLPVATKVSTGTDVLILNGGGSSFTVKTNTGATVVTIAPGEMWYLYLTDNSTTHGTWGTTQFGVGTSTIDAGSLSGSGISADGNTLNQSHPIAVFSSPSSITAVHRAKVIVYTGGSGTISLPSASSLGDGFFTLIRNEGTGSITIEPDGSELIDSTLSIVIQPGESAQIHCSGLGFYTVGLGRSIYYNFTQLTKDVSASGTFTLTTQESSNKLLTFIGNPSSSTYVVVPAVVSVYYVYNNATTAQDITIKTTGGVGVAVSQSERAILFCDGTDVYAAQSTSVSSNISILDGTESSPSLNFASTTNTGLYKSGTVDIGFAVDGSHIGAVTAAGLEVLKVGPDSNSMHTLPDVSSDTVALLTATQTLTNKTLSAPIISSISNTGTLTLPTSTDTLVGRTTTDTLTNKTLSTGTSINAEVLNTSTSAMQMPSGTEAQRPTGAAGKFRFNSELAKFEGHNGTAWGSVGGGATGGGSDEVFVQNGQTVTTNYTIPAGKNAMSAGPITVNDGVVVTISSGSRWVVV